MKIDELRKLNKIQVDRINTALLKVEHSQNELKALVVWAYHAGVTDNYQNLEEMKQYIAKRFDLSCDFNSEQFQDQLQKARAYMK